MEGLVYRVCPLLCKDCFLRPVLWALGGLICVDNYVTRDPRVLRDDLSEDLLHLLPRPSQIPPCKNWKYCRRLGEESSIDPRWVLELPLFLDWMFLFCFFQKWTDWGEVLDLFMILFLRYQSCFTDVTHTTHITILYTVYKSPWPS